MPEPFAHRTQLRVRYSETDQLGTFYNSRALEWFEVGRTELLRALGLPYAEMEKRGLYLPLVEAHVNYRSRARYDDLLAVDCQVALAGKASLRFHVTITHANSQTPVCEGHTIHAMTDPAGKPIRCPAWLTDLLNNPNPAP